jgi:hypothetical protein
MAMALISDPAMRQTFTALMKDPPPDALWPGGLENQSVVIKMRTL